MKNELLAMMEEEAKKNGKSRKKKVQYYKGRYDTVKEVVKHWIEKGEIDKEYLQRVKTFHESNIQIHDKKEEYYRGCLDMINEIIEL